jgi:hypothetical protein
MKKFLTALLVVAIVVGPAIAYADYLPEAYAGCAEIKGNNPHYLSKKAAAEKGL